MVEISEVLCNNTLYFSEVIEFLDQFSWIFDFANTEILVQDVLSKIPKEWDKVFSCMTEEEIAQYSDNLSTEVGTYTFSKFMRPQYYLCDLKF